eukprot:TRINITY_DN17623_c0_g1_i1.p1 TRINITY_DN17623_c0_g1~~TRINITY_DN17623_c0_g1_i1.p1  ORF type:complete len:259 (+),score=52.65 TRINITY_DN17623_c0_g1_i1:592-1368(+)
MRAFSELTRENVFNYLPITFCLEVSVDIAQINLLTELKQFITFHNILEKNKDKVTPIYENMEKMSGKPIKGLNCIPVMYERREINYTRYRMPLTHFIGHNLWLLKSANLNRGRGVHIFQSLSELKRLLMEYCRGESSNNKQKSFAFILQKYIEAPLLIHDRKFDIRVWILITREMDCYLFKEGYIRTSSTKFALTKDHINNRFVHLINNAIQMHAHNCGQYEDCLLYTSPSPRDLSTSRMPSSACKKKKKQKKKKKKK